MGPHQGPNGPIPHPPPNFTFIVTNNYVKRFLIPFSFEYIFFYLKASLPPNTVSNPEVIVHQRKNRVIFWGPCEKKTLPTLFFIHQSDESHMDKVCEQPLLATNDHLLATNDHPF